MTWLGLDYDEGPFYQTHRFDRYKEVIQQLLDQGKAYRCYCSKGRLEALREQQMTSKQKPRYDGLCIEREDQPDDQPYVIRFRNPQSGQVVVNDLVRGQIVFENTELDDLIIARSDGSPTYNLTVVVDDLDMKLTHVIRGDDHLNNTPRQINILKALGAESPLYAHVPMILGADGKRLSKRHGAVGVMQYRDEGFLPEALLNYLVRLGWSHGDDEVFSIEQLIELFDLDAVNKSASTFNPDKLLWLNQHYIKNSSPEHIARHLSWHLGQRDIDPANSNGGGPDILDVIKAQQERAKTLVEMADNSRIFYQDYTDFDDKAARKNLKPAARQALTKLAQGLADVNWQAEAIHAMIEATAQELELKLGKVAQPLRVAVTGGAISPPIDMTLELIGRERSLAGIQRALDYIDQREQQVT